MQQTTWFTTLLDSLRQYAPSEGLAQSIPLVAGVLIGALLMARGARLTRGVTALGLVAVGLCGGAFLNAWLDIPLWICALAGGVAGLILGVAYFRVWLALSIGVFCAMVGVGTYATQSLLPHIAEYVSAAASATPAISAVQPSLDVSPVSAAVSSAAAYSGGLWAYLAEHVQNFQTNLGLIVGLCSLAGFVIGWLFPRFSSAVVAATTGTICFFASAMALLQSYWPDAIDRLAETGGWGWLPLAAAWLAALAANLRKPKPTKDAVEDETAAIPVKKAAVLR